jgi:hypothetical protein
LLLKKSTWRQQSGLGEIRIKNTGGRKARTFKRKRTLVRRKARPFKRKRTLVERNGRLVGTKRKLL